MDFYRLYQYLKRSENVRHLHRDMKLIKERFDGDRFDLLGAITSEDTQLIGIYIDDDVSKTLEKISDSTDWREKNNVGLCVVTEKPREYERGLIVPYHYDGSHHFHQQKELDVGALMLAYLAKKSKNSPLVQLAQDLYKNI